MGIPPPNFDDLYRNFLDQISTFKRSMKWISDAAVQDEVKDLMEGVEKSFKGKEYTTSEELFDDLAVKADKTIEKVSQLVLMHLEGKEVDQVLEDRDHLREEISRFKVVFGHHKDIDKRGLEPFLEHDWAQNEFIKLIKANQPWAMSKLSALLESGDERAFKLLAYEGPHKYHLRGILFTYCEHPKFISQVEKLIEGPPKSKVLAYALLEAMLNQKNYSWVSKLLISKINAKDSHLAYDLFQKLMNEHMIEYPWIQKILIKNLSKSKEWAITLTYRYFYEMPSQECRQFMELALIFARSCPELQITLAAYSVVLGNSSTFYELFEESLHLFRDVQLGFPKYFKDQVSRLEVADYELDLFADEYDNNKGSLCWEESTPIYQVNVFRLLMKSEQDLIRILGGNMDRREFLDPPVSKCFPVTHSAWIGNLRFVNGSVFPIVTEVANILQRHGISLYLPDSSHQLPSPHPNITLMRIHRELGYWFQDLSFLHQGGVRYPAMYNISEEEEERVEAARNSRLMERRPPDPSASGLEEQMDEAPKEAANSYAQAVSPEQATPPFPDPKEISPFQVVLQHHGVKVTDQITKSQPFCVMGAVGDGHKQFAFLDVMMQYDMAVARQRILFTYNEGGNCLVGEDAGEPYAIVGKDVLELNRDLLSTRLSEIGMNKNSGGVWVLGKSYPKSECRINNDDIKMLLSFDMGLTSSDQVYFVEQPEFHLDMGMVILDGKKILVSDSVMATRTLIEYFQSEIDAKRIKKSEKTRVRLIMERRNEFKREAFARKIFEDAAAEDLERQGFNVIRVGGIYRDITKPHPRNHRVNFFNFVSLTTPESKKVVLALGCNRFFQAKFREMIEANLDSVDEIHFLNQDDSEALLCKEGGIHCVMKLLSKPSPAFDVI